MEDNKTTNSIPPSEPGNRNPQPVRETGGSQSQPVRESDGSQPQSVRETGGSQSQPLRETGGSQSQPVRESDGSQPQSVRETADSQPQPVRETTGGSVKADGYRFLLWELVKKGIKLKYRRSYLGILWTLIEPILTTIVLSVVFGVIFNRTDKEWPVYILTGRMLYGYFNTATNACMKSIRGNAAMIKKVYVPKILYPLANAIYTYIIFLISLIVLVGFMIVQQITPTLELLWVWLPLIQIFCLSLGIGLILTTIEVPFRDMEYLWSVLTLLIMYVSAIFYDASVLENSQYSWIMRYNPLYGIIKNFRNIVFGTPIDWSWMLNASLASIGILLIGVVVFKKNENKFILHI